MGGHIPSHGKMALGSAYKSSPQSLHSKISSLPLPNQQHTTQSSNIFFFFSTLLSSLYSPAMAPPPTAAMPLLPPGFRFHPTDAELITHYLANQSSSSPIPAPIIAEVNIYRSNPWELPAKALFGARDGEWFFFSPRDRKYPNGARPNRAAGDGYWKATGTDKPITAGDGSSSGAIVGVKKALVFYRGKPPRGVKTDWIMHEYRLASSSANGACKRRSSAGSASSMRLDDWVLCRIHKKSSNGSTNLHNFSSSSEHDHEQEESSTVEESSMNTTTTTNNNTNMSSPKSEAFDGVNDEELQELRPMAIAKSCSITDLLNTVDYASLSHLLLDGAAETAACYDQLPAPGTETEESALIYTPPNPWQTLNCSNNNNNSSLSYLNDDAIAVPQLAEQDYYYSSNGDQHLNGGAVKRKRSTSGSYCNQLHINGGLQAAGSPLNSSSSGFEYSGMLIHPFLMNNHQLQM